MGNVNDMVQISNIGNTSNTSNSNNMGKISYSGNISNEVKFSDAWINVYRISNMGNE